MSGAMQGVKIDTMMYNTAEIPATGTDRIMSTMSQNMDHRQLPPLPAPMTAFVTTLFKPEQFSGKYRACRVLALRLERAVQDTYMLSLICH